MMNSQIYWKGSGAEQSWELPWPPPAPLGPVLDFASGGAQSGACVPSCATLADAEGRSPSMRLRQVIAEDNPVMPAIDQDAWAERLDYSKRKLSQALDTFRRTRAENYELLKDLPEETFARTGRHSKRGTITLLDLLRIFAEHPEKHVQQIHAVRAAFKEFKAAQAASAPAAPVTSA